MPKSKGKPLNLKQTADDVEQADCQNPTAEFELGNAYYNGIGVEKSDSLAFLHWLNAAKNGHVQAKCCVGLCYKNGIIEEF